MLKPKVMVSPGPKYAVLYGGYHVSLEVFDHLPDAMANAQLFARTIYSEPSPC